MTDHVLKPGTGAFAVSGVSASMKVHRRPPPHHPIHNLVGRVAADWSLVEHTLDLIIWQLARLDDETGACLTAQISGVYGRIPTIVSLSLRRGLGDSILKQIKDLYGPLQFCQNHRNRIVHDPWYLDDATQLTEQFKSMAKEERLFGFHEVTEVYVNDILEKIGRRIEEIGDLRNAITACLG
jgi:hypothetical protein